MLPDVTPATALEGEGSLSSWSSGSEVAEAALDQIKLQGAEVIGRGQHGVVYKVVYYGSPAALKVVEQEEGVSPYQAYSSSPSSIAADGSHTPCARQAASEAVLSSAFFHPNIVQTLGHSSWPAGFDAAAFAAPHCSVKVTLLGGDNPSQETRLLLELCDLGSLSGAVAGGRFKGKGSGGLHWLLICETLQDIASGLAHLHALGVVHLDLTLRNVLLRSTEAGGKGFTAKISDFGLSRLLPDTPAPQARGPRAAAPQGSSSCSAASQFGTYTHLAPELLSEGALSTAADVYALGILMWELVTGRGAYQGLHKTQVLFGVATEGLRPAFEAGVPAWYTALATACWDQDESRRPKACAVEKRLQERAALLRAEGRK